MTMQQGAQIKSMKRKAPRLPSIACPHCGESAFARTGGKTTETFRELYYYCHDRLMCGHVFTVQMSITRTIIPSRRPNAEVILPIAPPPWPANDEQIAANDNRQTRKVE